MQNSKGPWGDQTLSNQSIEFEGSEHGVTFEKPWWGPLLMCAWFIDALVVSISVDRYKEMSHALIVRGRFHTVYCWIS